MPHPWLEVSFKGCRRLLPLDTERIALSFFKICLRFCIVDCLRFVISRIIPHIYLKTTCFRWTSIQSPHSTRVDRSSSVVIYVNEDTGVKEILGQQVTRQFHGSVKFEYSSLSPSTPIPPLWPSKPTIVASSSFSSAQTNQGVPRA